MLRLTRPSEAEVHRFLQKQSTTDLSYVDVGATKWSPPSGYDVDRNRIRLGGGVIAWRRATEALQQWKMFQIPWLQVDPIAPPIQAGENVTVVARYCGLYFLNACRIVYVVDEIGGIERRGFAYGTLAAHAESGEERFTVEWDHSDDSVSYEILAFSRPRHWAARLFYPLTRQLQSRFAVASKAAMVRAVGHL